MKSIGKYEVLNEIGSSGTGTTYRVRDNFQKQELALKFLHEVPQLDAAAHDQFCRELVLYSDLTHRHLAKVVDLGEIEGRIYIATKLLSGSDLDRFASNNRELPIAIKLGILAQACEGLAFAHSRSITHGAIKPANLLIDAGNDLTILDFGAAQWQSLILAAGGRPEGLLASYLAPEQILGQPSDPKTDLFSLALIAYEFLAGRYPFQVPASLIPREIVHSEPEPLRKVSPEIPEDLEQLIIKGLKKKPEERIQSAEEFAAVLYRIAQQLRRSSAAAPVPAASPVVNDAQAAPAPAADQPQAAPDSEQTSKTPKRGEVQSGRTEEQPWTTRSYASSGSMSDTRSSVSPAPAIAPNTAFAEPPGMPASVPAPPSASRPAGPPQPVQHAPAQPGPPPPAGASQAAARVGTVPAPLKAPARPPIRNVRRVSCA